MQANGLKIERTEGAAELAPTSGEEDCQCSELAGRCRTPVAASKAEQWLSDSAKQDV
jgi:hypothetical protein